MISLEQKSPHCRSNLKIKLKNRIEKEAKIDTSYTRLHNRSLLYVASYFGLFIFDCPFDVP